MTARKQLEQAVEQKLINPDQLEPLLAFLQKEATTPRFDFTHLLYYFGGMLAIGALSLFMNLGWEQFGGWGIFFICLLYAGIALLLTGTFARRGHEIPAGIMSAFVIALTPLAIYGVQQGLGYWPEDYPYNEFHRLIKFLWIYMELGTLIIGALVLWKYRYPFATMPIAVALWYLAMDVTELFLGQIYSFQERALITMWFGLVIIVIAFWSDIRTRSQRDYSFWLYLFGVLAFWGGLTAQNSDSELSKFFYFCINLGLIGLGAFMVRRVFVVFGGLGAALYIGHLAEKVFKDSWMFPISLTVLGIGIVYLGILWQRNEARITANLGRYLPEAVAQSVARRAG